MCKPDPVFFIPGPGEVLSAVRLRYAAAGLAVAGVVSFAVAYAALLAAVTLVFVAAVGGFAVWTRRFRHYEAAPEGAVATVTIRRGQGVRAITTGQRAIGAPRTVLPGQVLTAAEGGKVER